MKLVSVEILLLPPLFVSIIILFVRRLFCVLCMTFSIQRSSSHHKGLWGFKHNDDSDIYWMKSIVSFLFLDRQWEMFGSLCFSRRWCKDDCSFEASLSTTLGTSVQGILELYFPIKPLLLWTLWIVCSVCFFEVSVVLVKFPVSYLPLLVMGLYF